MSLFDFVGKMFEKFNPVASVGNKIIMPDDEKRQELVGKLGVGTAAAVASNGFNFSDSLKNTNNILSNVSGIKDSISNLTDKKISGYTSPEISMPETRMYDVSSYGIPQYKNGGVPNNGKPAIIYDMRTMKPTGTMNEQGPEKIVPAFDNNGSYSLVDELIPKTTANITIEPDKNRLNMQNYSSPTPSQSIVSMPAHMVEPGVTTIKPANTPSITDTVIQNQGKGSGQNNNIITGENNTSTLGFGDMGNVLKNIARAYSYYVDSKRGAIGQGPGALTKYLDWSDKMDLYNKQYSKKTDKEFKTYDAGQETGYGIFDPATGTFKKLGYGIKATGTGSSSGGKPMDITTEESDLRKFQGGGTDIKGNITMSMVERAKREPDKVLDEFSVIKNRQGLENSKVLPEIKKQVADNSNLRQAFILRLKTQNPNITKEEARKQWEQFIG